MFKETEIVKEKIKYNYNELYDKHNCMHIAFNVNASFFMQMGVAIISVLENNPQKAFSFHVFVDTFNNEDAEKLKTIAEKYKQTITIYVMDMQPLQGFHIKVKRFSRVTYLRLLMPKVLREIDKYLYMDADMICLSSLTDIEMFDLDRYAFAAVSDLPEAVEYRSNFLKLKNGKYFNDGLMWIDVKKWNEQQITEKCFEYQGADPSMFLGQTQDILNIVMDGNILFIDRKFNVMSEDTELKDAVIYHFFGRFKPWEMVLNKYDKLWRKYLTLSPWPDMPSELPPKKPQYYHDYKKIASINYSEQKYLKALNAFCWYSILKIRLKLGL